MFVSRLYNCHSLFFFFSFVPGLVSERRRSSGHVLEFLTVWKSSRVQTGTPCLIPGVFFFLFDVRLLMQTHIPAVCKSFYPHVIITHEEFDIHLCKVAEKGRLGLAKKPPKRLINRTGSSIWSLPQSRSWFGWKELEIHCPRPKIMVNRSSAFPVVSAADPWRLGSDWCLIVLCCCSSFSSSVARKCRGNWAIISDLST